MNHRRLGRTSIDVSRIALGTVTFGREIDQAASFDLLDHAIDSGINLLDTSEVYGGGHARAARLKLTGVLDEREVSGEMHASELIIGQWLSRGGRREKVVLQTKLVPPLNRARVIDGIDACLKRLQTDHIDIMMFHSPDRVHPVAESLEAMGDALRAGKVRAIGCSNFSVPQLSEALELSRSGAPRLEATQFNYNLAKRDAELDMLAFCRAQEVGTETYSPLGAGFLTGKYPRDMQTIPGRTRFDVLPAHRDIYFHDEKFDVVDRLAELSRESGEPMPRLAMAWVLQNPSVDTVLIGARERGQIDNALDALALTFRPEWNRQLDGGE